MSRTLDLGALYGEYNSSPNEQLADTLALTADWMITERDVFNAMADVLLDSQEPANVE